MQSKNKILIIHAKWLHDNGYYKQFIDCVHQANTYEDVRQIRARKRNEMEQKIHLPKEQ